MCPDVLIDADTIRSPELRHEIPAGVIDPFLYGEAGGVAFAATSTLDSPTIAEARPDLRQLDMIADLGLMDLIAGGAGRFAALLEVRLRACRFMGVTSAVVPPGFPLETAEYLRAGEIELQVDRELFAGRRRVKTLAELAGIRRATAAAEAGLSAAREAVAVGLTMAELRVIVRRAVETTGAALGDFTVSRGPQTATGHGPGSGPIVAGEPVIVDLAPQDRDSACFSDIARTFVVGRPDPEIAAWHALVVEVLEDSIARVGPGVLGRDLWGAACARFEAEGFPTQRRPGATVMEGFPTALGHGVGLEIHEAPGLGRTSEAFVAGDVITIEPFLCRPGFGGVQVEEILLVTEGGCERLSGLSTAL